MESRPHSLPPQSCLYLALWSGHLGTELDQGFCCISWMDSGLNGVRSDIGMGVCPESVASIGVASMLASVIS